MRNTENGQAEHVDSLLVNMVPAHLPAATLGTHYEAPLMATGGTPPYRWTIHGGQLPAGFALVNDRIMAERVTELVASRLRVRVTDHEGNHSDADTAISSSDPNLIIDTVRHRGVFLLNAVVLALAAGMVLIAARIGIGLETAVIHGAAQLRAAVGLPAPQGRPDWYIIGAIAIGPLCAFVVAMIGIVAYRRSWARRLTRCWGRAPVPREFATIQPLPERCSASPCPHCQGKLRYVRRLLDGPAWKARWDRVRDKRIDDANPSTLTLDQYQAVSESAFALIERDIAERAMTTGLLVGIGRSRWLDALTIAASSIEMQMFVLSTLGKRPGPGLWWQMLQRCSASLFINVYLNREDTFALNLLIKKSAWSLHAAAASAQWAANHLEHSMHQHLDGMHEHASGLADSAHHFDSSDVDADELHHSLGTAAQLASSLALFSLTVGSVAMNQIALFVEHWSNALVQGSLAAGILYWHGCSVAADVLALNQEHRDSHAFRRTPLDGARRMAIEAGEILRVATRQLRSMYRERRVQVIKTVASKDTVQSTLNRMREWFEGRVARE